MASSGAAEAATSVVGTCEAVTFVVGTCGADTSANSSYYDSVPALLIDPGDEPGSFRVPP